MIFLGFIIGIFLAVAFYKQPVIAVIVFFICVSLGAFLEIKYGNDIDAM